MNHKLNKKKVAFVMIIAVLIISLGVFLFNNVNQSTKKETPKKVQEKTVQKEEKKKEEAEVNFTISFLPEIVHLETMPDKLMMDRLIKNIKDKEVILHIF